MRRILLASTALLLALTGGPAVAITAASAASGPAKAPQSLFVCNNSTLPCPPVPSTVHVYATVQSAVDAANPGDWIFIWPGVYHEKSVQWPTAGVWIQKPDLHIRGLDRNGVIIDGSKGTASHPCPSAASKQDFTPRDGIVVWKASGVTIQNLTVCDYLAGKTGHGNEIWWNGGDGSGKIGMGAYSGSYLTATSMYGPKNVHSRGLAQYGIFVSNARGPGSITQSYGSNMADAAYYVGACQRQCNTVLAHDTGVNSALGFSGTNAGGRLVIKQSVFELNRTGLAPNSLNNSDAPPPQDGRCPGSKTKSCMVIEDNLVANNNNANAPTTGITPAVGAGIELAGGIYDTVRDNRIVDQGSWGVVVHDYPDPEKPPPGSHCQGGIKNDPLPGYCDFPARGNAIYANTFAHDGFFGNLTNSDLATETLASYTPRNCFFGNLDGRGLTSAPARIERANVDGKPCGRPGTGSDADLFDQLLCATGFLTCPVPPNQARYPKQTRIVILPLTNQPTMPHPCADIPAGLFCP